MSNAKLGILMLDTTFERIKGDIGNPTTFSFPVVYQVVNKATISRVVKNAEPSLIDPFVQAAKHLEQQGVQAITTSCGFLALYQQEIGRELSVPFYSSSLIQIPLVASITGGTVGIITARKQSLSKKHLETVGVSHLPVVIEGMDQMPSFSGAIIEENIPLDIGKVASEIQQVTKKLISENSDLTAIVLECTNMPPYKQAIKEITSLPIFDIISLTNYVLDAN